MVFVVGAGASKEVKLPTGTELKDIISDLLDIRFKFDEQEAGDYVITSSLRKHVKSIWENDINPYLHEAWHIRDALPQAISIDNFLDAHGDNTKLELCWKLAIAKSILAAEKNSLLYLDKNDVKPMINFKAINKSWYMSFFQLLTKNCSKKDLEDRFKKITLIIFNYDRCIEHFIYYGLQNYYKLDSTESARLISNINIIHPYWLAWSLPFLGWNTIIDFWKDPTDNNLLELSKQIKTFHESADSSQIANISKNIAESDKIIFLWFVFHELNMNLIAPHAEILKKRKKEIIAYATTYWISDSDIWVIKNDISKLFDNKIHFNTTSKACVWFFEDFWRSISF